MTVSSVLPHLFSFTVSRSPGNHRDAAVMWMRRKTINFLIEWENKIFFLSMVSTKRCFLFHGHYAETLLEFK